ncbi:lytic murein transglycosylase B [Coxiella endosymbiont of Amblyomma sculptum]|uniref:lytic murein transglycosylase B n=1 Tax=Coxiella endosymbiont of Amblyomma sculptum TaxID=2487929 RepID=UPI00132E91CD|nr:lytic murein transglycosylase B [Coxiella endosymbiont of Amblyomma sculptum]QHG92627.1 lytic murein transglycosylase B [Coxiella endosymbiont of Amblyomma sculptum]
MILCSTVATARSEPTDDGLLLLPKARVFVEYMVKHYRFKRKKLVSILSHARYNREVMYNITHPYEKRPWNFYRDCFLTKTRIRNGVDYWKSHRRVLERAYRIYGIPPEIVVAIIGIETNYGRCTGNYSALDTLSTLAFCYKSRARFFLFELIQFFLLTKEQKLPILLIHSSYAGAIGISQFMPSTYRHFAVNSSKKEHINLIKSNDDAIISVANFLRFHGWKKEYPVAYSFSTSQGFLRFISEMKREEKAKKSRIVLCVNNSGTMSLFPIPAVYSFPHTTEELLTLFRRNNCRNFWIVFPNFFVIMQYNPHKMYAMVVYQLSRMIHEIYTTNRQRT